MEIPHGESEEEKELFLQQQDDDGRRTNGRNGRKKHVWSYLRIAVEIALVLCIACLLLRRSKDDQETHALRSPVPVFPRKTQTFIRNESMANEEMFATRHDTQITLHKWLPLSSDARGYISIPDWQSYDLATPLNISTDRMHDGPGYMVSMFHQLHCLSYLVQHFQQGYAGVELDQEVAHHSAHCIDFIRQGVMCAGDVALEGKTETPGFGFDHSCVDYQVVLDWANEHSAEKWRNLMPDEAVL